MALATYFSLYSTRGLTRINVGSSFFLRNIYMPRAHKCLVWLCKLTCSFISPASCVSAGFTSCCTDVRFDGCGVGYGIDRCYCDQACFRANDCCDDITEVPCLPGILEYHIESVWFAFYPISGLPPFIAVAGTVHTQSATYCTTCTD